LNKIVLKFGGTSLSSPERMKYVATFKKEALEALNQGLFGL